MASIFSKIIAGDIPCYKVAEDEHFFAFLDINPLVKGHTLVVPKREVDYIFDLQDEELAAFHVFAKSVAPYLQGAVESSFADGKYTISGLQAGYYLVKDKNNTLTSADDCYTAYIMQVVRNVTASPKGEKPSVEKKVQERTREIQNLHYRVTSSNNFERCFLFQSSYQTNQSLSHEEFFYILLFERNIHAWSV